MATVKEGGGGKRRKDIIELPIVRSVERAGRVLEALLVASPQGLRLAEIAKEAQLHKTTALRLLRTLTEIGVVHRYRESDRYAWDAIHWLAVATKLRAMMTCVDLVQAMLDELATVTGETIGLAYPDITKRKALFVTVSLSRNLLRVDPGDLRKWPLHAGAHGKICLAYLPDKVLQTWLQGPLPRITDHTITIPEKLLKSLLQVRERGYALSYEEGFVGACGLAVPVYNEAGEVMAALGLTAPVARMTEKNIQRWLPLLKKNSNKLTGMLYLRGNSNLLGSEDKKTWEEKARTATIATNHTDDQAVKI